MLKTLAFTTCTLFLVLTGCKKKDETKPADQTAETKPGEAKPSEAKPSEAKPAEPAPAAAGVTIANIADYEAKSGELMDKLTAIFVADGTNCDKLAGDVNKFVDDNKPSIDATAAYEKAHPDDKKAVTEKEKVKTKEFESKAGPSIDACKDNKAFQTAISKLPE
ncbi:MAG: hypothetical protein JWO36_17 [Myxococcales bacterium]|nr:hypothetical protein [Myxococcales bacterium]